MREAGERMGGRKVRNHNLASDTDLLRAVYVHPLTK
jgi:hypothetical protein